MRARHRAYIAIAILASGAFAGPPAARATWAGKPGLIAYAGPADDGYEIRLVRPDGSGDRLLATANTFDLAWSRDGEELTYWEFGTGLVRVRPNGSHRRVVVPQAAFETD